MLKRLFSCFGSRKVSPEPFSDALRSPYVSSPFHTYFKDGCSTSLCCKFIEEACTVGHTKCIEHIRRYEEVLFDDRSFTQYNSTYFTTAIKHLPTNACIETINLLHRLGYKYYDYYFYGTIIGYQRLDLLERLYSDGVRWDLSDVRAGGFYHSAWNNSFIDSREYANTFLYFLDKAEDSYSYDLIYGSEHILKLLRHSFDTIKPEALDEFPLARARLIRCLSVQVMFNQPHLQSLEEVSDIDIMLYLYPYQHIFNTIISYRTRKPFLLSEILRCDTVASDIVQYIVAKYIPDK